MEKEINLVGKEFGYDPTAKGTTAQYKKYLKAQNSSKLSLKVNYIFL